MKTPVIALVGRPNVGKSTLFNRLTRSRDAIVADMPGLTRDRHYGYGRLHPFRHIVIDTGGFEPIAKDGIFFEMAKQTWQAVLEADVVIFVVDGRSGITPQDFEIANRLRKVHRPVLIAMNKAEGMNHEALSADFYALGLGTPCAISAAHGDGVRDLTLEALRLYPCFEENYESTSRDGETINFTTHSSDADSTLSMTHPSETQSDTTSDNQTANALTPIKVAIAGRANVGKSTLINTLIGEERVVAFDMPGTTRDAIRIEWEYHGQPYVLIDTAGIRKRGKVFEAVEKFSVIKTLQAIDEANVVILLLDASQDISDQDAHIAGYILESGRALVIGVNKWDITDDYQRQRIKLDIERKLRFLNFAHTQFMSAKTGLGVKPLLKHVGEAYKSSMIKMSTGKLNRVLAEALNHQQPKRAGGGRPKLKYAHQGGSNPPIIVIHGNALDNVTKSYKRYLESRFIEYFRLTGTPLRIEFRNSENPFKPNK